MNEIGRRAFLVGAGLLSPLASLRGAARQSAVSTAAAGLNDFLALSSRLTGRARLDPAVGTIYLKALQSLHANRGLLEDLSRNDPSRSRTAAHLALERDIITAWYTGTYSSTDAVTWQRTPAL